MLAIIFSSPILLGPWGITRLPEEQEPQRFAVSSIKGFELMMVVTGRDSFALGALRCLGP